MVSKLAIYTEQEAAGKWCPADLDSLCLASDCMAWRWFETSIKNPATGNLEPNGETYGYCGLAHSPEPARDRS